MTGYELSVNYNWLILRDWIILPNALRLLIISVSIVISSTIPRAYILTDIGCWLLVLKCVIVILGSIIISVIPCITTTELLIINLLPMNYSLLLTLIFHLSPIIYCLYLIYVLLLIIGSVLSNNCSVIVVVLSWQLQLLGISSLVLRHANRLIINLGRNKKLVNAYKVLQIQLQLFEWPWVILNLLSKFSWEFPFHAFLLNYGDYVMHHFSLISIFYTICQELLSFKIL